MSDVAKEEPPESETQQEMDVITYANVSNMVVRRRLSRTACQSADHWVSTHTLTVGGPIFGRSYVLEVTVRRTTWTQLLTDADVADTTIGQLVDDNASVLVEATRTGWLPSLSSIFYAAHLPITVESKNWTMTPRQQQQQQRLR